MEENILDEWLQVLAATNGGVKKIEFPLNDESYKKHKAEERRVKVINPKRHRR